VRDYYRYLDEAIGSLLELLDDDTAVLVVSDHGAQRSDGVFCVNEWLLREGDLALHHHPNEITPIAYVDVDWARTRAWSEGGCYARVFMNVKGREPQGTIDSADYEPIRSDLKARLEATTDASGRSLGATVYRPEEIYRQLTGVAPDLIVSIGQLSWHSVSGVGYRDVRVQQPEPVLDPCNHAQYGAFILSAPNNPLRGDLHGVHLLDMAPTLLDLGGYDRPKSVQGTSLLESLNDFNAINELYSDDEEIVRQRLSGLGYI
jgi:predicted AlkP superfamily phosphohydrolase/phosphomutase